MRAKSVDSYLLPCRGFCARERHAFVNVIRRRQEGRREGSHRFAGRRIRSDSRVFREEVDEYCKNSNCPKETAVIFRAREIVPSVNTKKI